MTDKEFLCHYYVILAEDDKSEHDIFGYPRPKCFDVAVYREGYEHPVYFRVKEGGMLREWWYRAHTGRWRKLPFFHILRSKLNAELRMRKIRKQLAGQENKDLKE